MIPAPSPKRGTLRILVAMCAGLLAAGCGGGGSDPGANAPVPVSAAPDPAPTPAPTPTPDPGGDPAPADPPVAAVEIPPYEPDFEELFSLSKMHTIHVHVSEDEWNGLLNDYDHNRRNEVYRKADFYYGNTPETGVLVQDVGFRLRGNSFSRERPEEGVGVHRASNALVRVHFRIKFNEQFDEDESVYGHPSRDVATRPENQGREFMTVRSLNLKYNKADPTYTREVFSYDLFRRFGVQAPRQAYARLYVKIGNEAPRYMGVYLMGEHVDKTWARRRFGESTYVFKSLWQGEGPADLSRGDRDHSATTGRIGEEVTDPEHWGQQYDTYRPAYDLKSKKLSFEKAEDHINELIELLTGNPTREMLEEAIDIPQLLRAQAVNVFLGNWDDYWRNGNNYYLVRDPDSKRWLFVPYDYDIVLFDSIWGIDGVATAPFVTWGEDRLGGNPVLMDKVLAIDAFREEYEGYVRELVSEANGHADLQATMDRMGAQQALVAPYTDGYEARDSYPYLPSLAEIERYVDARIDTARRELGF